jgi:uncharacterized protein
MTIGQDKLEIIMDYAICIDWVVAFDGKSKGNQHLHRVNKIVVFLAEHEYADYDICVAGGWLHDLGLVKGNKGHCFSGVEPAKEYLIEIGVDPEDVDRVTHCIEAHDGEVEAKTPEAQVVHDADTIDKMGPFGYMRHVWKISLIEDLDSAGLLDFVRNHIAERESKLHFTFSKELVKDLNRTLDSFLSDRDAAIAITEAIAEHASEGITSEKVAEMIIAEHDVDEDFRDTVKSQMAVDYLD